MNRRLAHRRLAPAALLVAALAVRPAPAARAAVADSVAAPPAPSGLEFRDVPNDLGRAIDLRWRLAPGDAGPGGPVRGYVLLRARSVSGPWADVDSVPAGVDSLRDGTVRPGTAYFYRVAATGPGPMTIAFSGAPLADSRVSKLAPVICFSIEASSSAA